MRLFRKLVILLTLLLCGGCDFNGSSSSSKNRLSTISEEVKHDYDEVADKMILWSNIFGIELDSYYVYFFSKTCSHCNDFKNVIIPVATERDDIYFVESSEQDKRIKDVSVIIGLTSIDGFGITGYPSLVKIEDDAVSKNIGGVIAIRNEIMN